MLITVRILLGKRHHLTKYHSSVVCKTVAKVDSYKFVHEYEMITQFILSIVCVKVQLQKTKGTEADLEELNVLVIITSGLKYLCKCSTSGSRLNWRVRLILYPDAYRRGISRNVIFSQTPNPFPRPQQYRKAHKKEVGMGSEYLPTQVSALLCLSLS